MAKQESLRTSECPVARTLESIGERWCLMIIREAFDDVRRFSEFQKNLGLAKNILAARLKHRSRSVFSRFYRHRMAAHIRNTS